MTTLTWSQWRSSLRGDRDRDLPGRCGRLGSGPRAETFHRSRQSAFRSVVGGRLLKLRHRRTETSPNSFERPRGQCYRWLTTFSLVNESRRRDLNPHAPLGALGPQGSARVPLRSRPSMSVLVGTVRDGGSGVRPVGDGRTMGARQLKEGAYPAARPRWSGGSGATIPSMRRTGSRISPESTPKMSGSPGWTMGTLGLARCAPRSRTC